jgi:hypothetical protein
MLLQGQFSRKCSCYGHLVILHHAVCIFIYFNSLNLQNTNILHFSSVVGVFYVDSVQCLLQVHHFVTVHYMELLKYGWYVSDGENFSVFLFLVIQYHCIKWPQSLVRFNPQVRFLTYCWWERLWCPLQVYCSWCVALWMRHTLNAFPTGRVVNLMKVQLGLLGPSFWDHELTPVCYVMRTLFVHLYSCGGTSCPSEQDSAVAPTANHFQHCS